MNLLHPLRIFFSCRATAGTIERGLLVLAVVGLSACGPIAGPATQRLDAESVSSILAYRDGAETAVAGLLDAYESASKRELDALAELDARDAEVRTLEYDAEGKAVERRAIPSDEALAIVRSYAAGRDKIAAERARFEAAWAQNAANIRDALELRAELRRFLLAEGVSAEDVDALAAGIQDHLNGRDR